MEMSKRFGQFLNGRSKQAAKAIGNVDKIFRYSGHDLKTGPFDIRKFNHDLKPD
jgi:hypothetical protein